MIDQDCLTGFLAFAEHMSFTRGAKEVHVTQPALHAQVRRLTESLGTPLYARTTRGLVLTPAGRRVLAFARESRDRAGALREELRTGAARRPVVLAAGEGAFLHLLGEAIRAFRARDEAPLRLLTRDREGVLDALETGEAHLGVTVLESAPDGFEVAPLATVGHVVALPRAHALARTRRVELGDLAGVPLILPPRGRPHRAALDRALVAAGVVPQIAVEATGWSLMLHFVRLGLGAAIVNAFCTPPPGTVARPLVGLSPVAYRLVVRRDAALPPAAATLARLARASARGATMARWTRGGGRGRASS
jgi:DNA-binding transcriptional LysR family regulator